MGGARRQRIRVDAQACAGVLIVEKPNVVTLLGLEPSDHPNILFKITAWPCTVPGPIAWRHGRPRPYRWELGPHDRADPGRWLIPCRPRLPARLCRLGPCYRSRTTARKLSHSPRAARACLEIRGGTVGPEGARKIFKRFSFVSPFVRSSET